METEEEAGGRRPQAKDAWSPQELEDAAKTPPLEPPEGTWPTLVSDFRPPELGENMKRLLRFEPPRTHPLPLCDNLLQWKLKTPFELT